MKKIVSVFILTALFAMTLCICSSAGEEDSREPSTEGNTVTVEDLVGREVVQDHVPQRVAAMGGPTYEMMFMLGAKDRVVMVKSGHTTNYPLALLTNPDLADYIGVAANPSSAVNIEDYLKNDIDLVLYYDNEPELKKFENAGIPAAVLTLHTGNFDTLEEVKNQTLDEYIPYATKTVRILAELLQDEEVMAEYKDWEAYCTEKLRMIYERTSGLSDEERRTVYWANTWGENVLASYTLKYLYYEIWLAGGTLIGPEGMSGNFPEVTKEQLFAWDPEIILVDNHGGYPKLVIQDLYNNPDWSALQAVQNEEIYEIPSGVFFLDKGSTTSLMVLWLATVLHPDLFSDVNMVEEIQYYYREFYEYELTEEQAQHVLDGWFEKAG